MLIPQTGMEVALTSFDVTANDIANISTTNYRPSRVDAAELPGRSGAMVAGVTTTDDAPPDGTSGTDLAEEMTELVLAGAAYGANAAAFKAQTTAFLVDILA